MIHFEKQEARRSKLTLGSKGYGFSICPICGDTSTNSPERLFKIKRHWILTCKCTNHQFTEPILAKSHVQSVYSNDYFKGRGDGYPDYLSEEKILIDRGRWYAHLLSKHMSTGTILDVGSAAGFILKGLTDNGWSGFGIEPNQEMADYARKRFGLSMHIGTLEDFSTNDQFDVVLLIQVIAHFYDLRRAISKAAQLTKQSGYLLVETWNKNSLTAKIFGRYWHEYNPPSVLHWFTPASLDSLLQQFGYRNVTQGRPPRWITGSHAKHILKFKLARLRFGSLVTKIIKMVPDRIALPYPAEDLFWCLYKKS